MTKLFFNRPTDLSLANRTQPASTISDFQEAVSSNEDVETNTQARHPAADVTDSDHLDFTIIDQVITATLKPGAVTATELSSGILEALANNEQETAPQLLAKLTTVDGGSSGLDADLLDGEQGAFYLDRNHHSGQQAIETVAGLQTSLDSKEPADSTILKAAALGVTVQPYNANTVIDEEYLRYTSSEQIKLLGIQAGAEVNVNADWNAIDGKAQILNIPPAFPPAYHTHLAVSITDLDTAISSSTEVEANSAARHVAASVSDSAHLDFTITGQMITATVKAGSITATELSTEVNQAIASKEPADATILKSGAIGVTVQAYNANTVIDANYLQYTAAEQTKLAGIAAGAEVNVNADWNAVDGDARILNQPTLGTASTQNTDYFATAAQGTKADTAVQPVEIANFETTAQLNTRDTNSRNRANHTGEQSIGTVTGLQTALNTAVQNGGGVVSIVALTQAAYDELTPVATTLYIITD